MRIGFAGLGAIGSPMADRCAAVHSLTVWNRTAGRAGEFAKAHSSVAVAGSPRELAAAVEAVITCVPSANR